MNEINIWPRRSGKTAYIIDHSTDRDCIVVKNKETVKFILSKVPTRCVMTPHDLLQLQSTQSDSLMFDTVYVDEYLYFNNMEKCELNDALINIKTNDIKIYTTSNRLYNKDLVNLLRIMKSRMDIIDFTNAFNSLTEIIDEVLILSLNDLRYSLLINPNFDIKSKGYFDTCSTDERYKIEVEGKLYTE